MDTSVKQTPRVGPFSLSLLPLFNSLSDGKVVPVPKVSVLEGVDCIVTQALPQKTEILSLIV